MIVHGGSVLRGQGERQLGYESIQSVTVFSSRPFPHGSPPPCLLSLGLSPVGLYSPNLYILSIFPTRHFPLCIYLPGIVYPRFFPTRFSPSVLILLVFSTLDLFSNRFSPLPFISTPVGSITIFSTKDVFV